VQHHLSDAANVARGFRKGVAEVTRWRVYRPYAEGKRRSNDSDPLKRARYAREYENSIMQRFVTLILS